MTRPVSPSAPIPSVPESEGLPSRALLWLLAGFALLLVPQWDRLPVWLVACCAALAGWRWLAQQGRVRLPGRLIRTGIMLALVAVYIASVRGRFTVDTAASFFVLSVGMKWLETRSPRDFYVLFFILVYLTAVNFLFQQDILWALVNLSALGLLLVGVQVLNAPDLPETMASGWRRLAGLLLKTLPVVVLLFLFFPRMSPLWSVPLVSGDARTGISDTMTPGDISRLAQNSERAFRVTFGGRMPPYPDRYWRGLVLDYLDGETWRQGDRRGAEPLGRVAVDGGAGPLAENEYEVLLEPTDQRWAFGLKHSEPASANVYEEGIDLFRFRRPADSVIRYRLRIEDPDSPSSSIEPPQDLRRYLQLPDTGNPRARRLARELSARYDDETLIQALLNRFSQQAYYYTLRPPLMPDNGIDALLFDIRRGFCSHYAGATTFLLRAAGIPARVVIGYQGGDSGADGAYLIVRQYDAHAWVEAWLQGRGWVRIDPTAAISPARIESGLREAVADEGSFLEDSPLSPQRYGDLALVRWATLQLDRINYHWQRWVVGYQGQSQLDLMSRLPGGFGLKELGYLTAGIVGAALLVAGLFSAARYRRRGRQEPGHKVISAWYRLCNRAGVPVRQGETPATLADRLAQARPGVAETARRFARMVNSYYYSADAESQSDQLLRMRRLLATMKRQLRKSKT